MSASTLITIGIIVYMIGSVVIKIINFLRKSAPQVSGGEEKEPDKKGWAEKINDFFEEIKEELENADPEAGNPKHTQIPPEYYEELSWDDETESISFTKSPELQTVQEEEDILPEPAEESHRNYHGTNDRPGRVYDHRCVKRRFEVGPSEMKKAVIWSEILSKPVGLREDA